MKNRKATWIACLALAMGLFSASAARAQFDLVIAAPTLGGFGGSIDINVFDPILNEADPVTTLGQVITVNTTALNVLLLGTNAGFIFDSLSLTRVPISGVESNLQLTGIIRSINPNSAGLDVTITGSALDYAIPAPGTAAIMTSSASDTVSGGFGGRTFQSFYDPGNTEFNTGAGAIPSTLLTFPPIASTGSDSDASPDVALGLITGNYALTNVSVITLGGVGSRDSFGGTTTVRAVPEPGSIALLLVGGSALALRMRRRKVEA